VEEAVRVFVKGASERVLAMCAWESESAHDAALTVAEAMAEQGYRVLALAEGVAPDTLDPSQTPAEPVELAFLGFVGMIDPLRPGVREAVAACHAAGITVCMITGDHPVTALAIARDLGLANRPDQVVAGGELEGKSPEELQAYIHKVRVFARVAPRQKLELVEAAKHLPGKDVAAVPGERPRARSLDVCSSAGVRRLPLFYRRPLQFAEVMRSAISLNGCLPYRQRREFKPKAAGAINVVRHATLSLVPVRSSTPGTEASP
jgi:hypothetical protein